MNAYSIVLYFVALKGAVAATDYCSLVCWNNATSVACNNSGKFADSCPADAKMVPIDDDLKQFIVDSHNVKRNFIAGGGEAKLSPACRMATMEWDEELTYMASLNAKTCAFTHDQCMKTAVFKSAGQCLGRMSYIKAYNATKEMDEAIAMWYNEVKYVNQSLIDLYPKNYTGKAFSHFAIMVNDVNVRVGCAVASYASKDPKYTTFMVVCNYAITNILGKATYKSCNKAASACTTGKNPQYPNLCSSSEDYGYGIIPKFELK